jgi:Targeting protein for Xklp2 (TPX2) domain
MQPPSPPALVREPKVTLSKTFPFQSDIRAEHRKEFEEKRKLWEARSSVLGASTSSQGSHPIRNQVRPVYPSAAPKLSTETRATQRREFDKAIRQKEAELERLRAEQAKQLEREEAEWMKQERRRLDQNVKAKPIPEWYQNAPRRGNTKA